jgi:hypothetical protein
MTAAARSKISVCTGCALAIGALLATIASALPAPGTERPIVETEKIALVQTVGKPRPTAVRQIYAGILDGKIGARPVHGSLRAIGVSNLKDGSEIVSGTEFDSAGSRSFVIHNHITFNNGRVTNHGTGKWTGGTGAYAHARGAFKITGGGPIGGVTTNTVKGHIIY